MTPQARQDRIVVQEVGDETIIYDEQRDHVHRLNRTAALVWRHCDGRHTVAALVKILQAETATPVTEDMVWLALDRLEKEHLLQSPLARAEEAGRVTRRQVLRKAALVGGMSLLLPVVQSMVAPTPAMAASTNCAGRGQTFDYTGMSTGGIRRCCNGYVPGPRGKCVSRTGQI